MKYKISELEEQFMDWLSQCSAHEYLDLLVQCGIVSDDTELEDIDKDN